MLGGSIGCEYMYFLAVSVIFCLLIETLDYFDGICFTVTVLPAQWFAI